MSRQPSAEKEQFWRLAIGEQAQSGISIRDFCQQQELSEPSFHAWKRKLKDRDAADQLVPVKIVDKDQPTRTPSLEIQLAGGTVVRFFEAQQ